MELYSAVVLFMPDRPSRAGAGEALFYFQGADGKGFLQRLGGLLDGNGFCTAENPLKQGDANRFYPNKK